MGWGTALGIGQIALGGILSATGVGAGVGVPLIMGGVQTVAGDIQGKAAKGAAQTQAQSAQAGIDQQAAAAQQALLLNRQIAGDVEGKQRQLYEQMRGDFAPYMQLGAGATGNLGQLVGLPPSGASAGGTNPASVVPAPMAESAPSGQGRKVLADPQQQAAISTQSTYGPTVGGVSRGVVTLRGPDGSTRMFQAGDPQIRSLVASGAQVV